MHYVLAAGVITLYIYFRFGAKALAGTLIIFALMALSRGFVALTIPMLMIAFYLLKSEGSIPALNWPKQSDKKVQNNPGHYVPGRPTIPAKFLEIYLFPDTGLIAGRVLRGEKADAELTSLSLEECLKLIAHYKKKDKESELLLRAYLDKLNPDWKKALKETERADPSSATITGSISTIEARAILGLSQMAKSEDIKTAHRNLMKKFHPDQGGAPILAAKINMAKDQLLSHT